MIRPVAALVVSVLPLPASSDEAPVPKSRLQPRPYFPTKVGAKRVYRSDGGLSSVHTVTRVEKRDGVLLASDGRDGCQRPARPGTTRVTRRRIDPVAASPAAATATISHGSGTGV